MFQKLIRKIISKLYRRMCFHLNFYFIPLKQSCFYFIILKKLINISNIRYLSAFCPKIYQWLDLICIYILDSIDFLCVMDKFFNLYHNFNNKAHQKLW
jgi:hypothetical protein